MGNILKSLFVIMSSFVFVQQIQAKWSPEAHLMKWTYSHPFKDTYAGTVWSVVNKKVINDSVELENKKFKSDIMKGEALEYSEIIRGKKDHRSLSDTLTIILPGIFSQHNGGLVKRTLNQTSHLNSHFIALPNTWTKEFIKTKSRLGNKTLLPGNIEEEAKVFYKILTELVQSKYSKYKTINLVGISYGALMSSIIIQMDKRKLINGKVRMLAPPVDFIKSLHKTDDLIEKMHNFNKTINLAEKAKTYVEYRQAEKQSDLRDIDIKRAPALVAFNQMQAKLKKTIKSLFKHNNNQELGFDKKKIDTDDSAFNYYDYYSVVFTEKERQEAEEKSGKIFFWLKKYLNDYPQLFKRSQIALLSTKDDYLNDLADWPVNSFELRSSIILVPNGGHVGFLNTKWFKHFSNYLF